jgi:hypothetical protein
MCDSRSAAAEIITRCIHVALGETASISISVYKFAIFDCSDRSERYSPPRTRGFLFFYFLWLHQSFSSFDGESVWSQGRFMGTLVYILVGRVYFLSRRKDECIERRRRQLRYSSKGSQHTGVAAGSVLTAWCFQPPILIGTSTIRLELLRSISRRKIAQPS